VLLADSVAAAAVPGWGHEGASGVVLVGPTEPAWV
jgi:hypothetical protein